MMSVTLNSRRPPIDRISAATSGVITAAPAGASNATPTKSTRMKLSPDCVADVVDPSTVDFTLHLQMPSTICNTHNTAIAPVEHSKHRKEDVDGMCYNLPPIRTPLHTSRKPPHLTLTGLDSPTLSKLPEDATSIPLEDNSSSAIDIVRAAGFSSYSPLPPRIPKPIPIAGTSRRAQSDTLAQTKSNQRRSIFGHYFHPRQLQHSSTGRTQSHTSYPLLSRSGKKQQPTNTDAPADAVQQDGRYNLTSSGSILENAAIQPIPVDYRMFAPPKDHVHNSAICGRFHSVDDLSVTLDLERKALPPLPSPLRRFCSSSEVNRSQNRILHFEGGLEGDDGRNDRTNLSPAASSNGVGMHGVYPLMTPVPILRQSSYCRSPSTDARSIGSYGISSQSHLINCFNLTESSRKLTMIRKSHGRDYFERRTSSSTSTSSTTACSDDNHNTVRNGVRFDPRVTVTEFEDAERVWYNDYELERLKNETILLAQEYLFTHPMEAEKYNRATLDPVTQTFRKRALFSLPVLSSGSVNSDDKEHSSLADSLSSLPKEALDELCKDQVKRILIVDPNPSILALFRKSLSVMFPEAELVTAQSAERALKLVKSSLVAPGVDEPGESSVPKSTSSSSCSKFEQGSDAFDIIIIEQSLYPKSPHIDSRKTEPLSTSTSSNQTVENRPGLTWNSSMPDMQKHASTNFLSITKPGSFFHHDIAKDRRMHRREPRCGSELTHAIKELMHQDGTDVSCPSKPTGHASAVASIFEWKALLIGVSMHPDHDAELMHEAGSDLVWGKPIPHVGHALRNQLLQALLDKRRGSPNYL
jgi:hypothetical protein